MLEVGWVEVRRVGRFHDLMHDLMHGDLMHDPMLAWDLNRIFLLLLR